MERLRAKLTSQTGASITYALLLFLVCAVLSSVILVAATAAAGRIGNLAETDQRYYSVTSAAELVKNEITNKNISVIRRKNNSEAEISVKNDSGTQVEPEQCPLLYNLAKSISEGGEQKNKTLEMSVRPNIAGSTPVKVVIIESWDDEGNLDITLYNNDLPEDEDEDEFRIYLKLVAEVDERNNNPYPDDSIMTDDNIESIESYSWNVVGMSTIN